MNTEKKPQELQKKKEEIEKKEEQKLKQQDAGSNDTQKDAPKPVTPEDTKKDPPEEQKEETEADKIKNGIPASGDARGKYLKEHYVDAHKDRKEKDKADLEKVRQKFAPKQGAQGTTGTTGTTGTAPQESFAPRAALQAGHSGSSFMEKMDTLSEIGGTALGHISDVGNIIADGMATDESIDDHGFGDAFSVASGGISTVFNAYDTARSTYGTIRDARNGNRAGAIAGTFESIGGLFGTAASITTAGSGIGALAGGSKQSGNIGNVVSGALDSFGALSSLVGSSYTAERSRQGRNKMNTMSQGVTDAALADSKKNKSAARGKLGENATEADLKNYDKERQARNSAKAKKYAAGMGSRAAAGKRKEGLWDTLGNLSSLTAGAAGIVGGGLGLGGLNVGKLISTFAGAIANVVGTASKIAKKASEKKSAALNKNTTVKEYIDRKTQSIKAETGNKVTDGEAANIAIARLGIGSNGPIAAESQVEQHKDSIFAALCEKRAENIHQAEESVRTEILTAMGLDPQKATKQAIISALGG